MKSFTQWILELLNSILFFDKCEEYFIHWFHSTWGWLNMLCFLLPHLRLSWREHLLIFLMTSLFMIRGIVGDVNHCRNKTARGISHLGCFVERREVILRLPGGSCGNSRVWSSAGCWIPVNSLTGNAGRSPHCDVCCHIWGTGGGVVRDTGPGDCDIARRQGGRGGALELVNMRTILITVHFHAR